MAKKKTYGFSWNRVLGVTNSKQKIARMTGIPTTKQGRRNKVRRVATAGCLTLILYIFGIAAVFALIFVIL